jgi:CDK-activating kinase assembly factor MAT1
MVEDISTFAFMPCPRILMHLVSAFNLINEIDLAATEARIAAFRAENAALIQLNIQREKLDAQELQEDEERDRREREERMRALRREEEEERQEREKERRAIIDGLVRIMLHALLRIYILTPDHDRSQVRKVLLPASLPKLVPRHLNARLPVPLRPLYRHHSRSCFAVEQLSQALFRMCLTCLLPTIGMRMRTCMPVGHPTMTPRAKPYALIVKV